jgi:mannose-1-phosphate guanylyltransferase
MALLHDTFIFILAGGSGERFWPLSRQKKPKHLLRLFSKKTLLEETIARFKGIIPPENLFILTNQVQLQELKRAIPDFPTKQIIIEPAKRDTGPATALATAIAYQKNPKARIGLFPSDALIQGVPTFQKHLRDSLLLLEKEDAFITFSIPPRYPSTGFGYLEYGEPLPKGKEKTPFVRVSRFIEKPNLATAKQYMESGRYGWNGGIFLWKAATYIEESMRLIPEFASFILELPKSKKEAYLEKRFVKLPKISIDYAIMEKAKRVIAAKTSFDWDDVGSWNAVQDHLGSDTDKNLFLGKVYSLESHSNIVHASSRSIALCGVDNLVIVETPDAILVCHRDKVQEIKKLHPQLPPELI